MDELIAFVNARLAAQEAQAQRELEFIQVAVNRDRSDQRRRVDPDRDDGARTVSPWTHREITRAEWMLADVAAKRAIVEMHYIIERKVTWVDADGDEWQNHQPVCVVCVEKYSMVDVPADLGPCRTVRLLASVYADHPDFRKEWRP